MGVDGLERIIIFGNARTPAPKALDAYHDCTGIRFIDALPAEPALVSIHGSILPFSG
jgi:hypothetical protein